MKHGTPQPWLEPILLLLLPSSGRDTVSGDLYEEFHEHQLPRLGPLRAQLWYARQVLSFVPQKLASLLAHTSALTCLCLFTAASGAWLGGVDLYLKHPGYMSREPIAAIILSQALLTLAALHLRPSAPLRLLSMFGTPALFWLACKAFLAMAKGADIEGYILLIALALIIQAALTLLTLPRRPDPSQV